MLHCFTSSRPCFDSANCHKRQTRSQSAYHLHKPCTNCFPFVNTQNLRFRSPPFLMKTMIVLVWTQGQNVSKCIRFQSKTHLCERSFTKNYTSHDYYRKLPKVSRLCSIYSPDFSRGWGSVCDVLFNISFNY